LAFKYFDFERILSEVVYSELDIYVFQ
jgi:hypothetical protein